jgi:RsiW-degrading membrane proteinase PrsW (M82 family)
MLCPRRAPPRIFLRMGQLQLALFGATPAILAMALFDWLDSKRPEPHGTLRLVAFGGILAAIPVIVIGEILRRIGPAGLDGTEPTYLAALYMSFVIAAFPEEAAKLASVYAFAWRRPEFDERMDGIVYGARAGLGFAAVENVAYLLFLPSNFNEYISIFIGRAFLAVPGHAIWGGIAGYFAARKRFDRVGPGALGGYLIAAMMHGLYDAWVFSAPVAIGRGHTWLALSIFGVPVLLYAIPALIVALGGLWLHTLVRRAIALDDHADASLQYSSAPIVPR